MPLVDHQIAARCADPERALVTPFDPALINPTSLDVRLGDTLLIEQAGARELVPYPLGLHSQEHPYRMVPGQFVLAPTMERIRVPDDLVAQFILKSSRAREGLEHLLAGFIDPGFEGILTMELVNSRQLHPVDLWPGRQIGQLVFSPLDVLPERSYRETGRYGGAVTVEESKG